MLNDYKTCNLNKIDNFLGIALETLMKYTGCYHRGVWHLPAALRTVTVLLIWCSVTKYKHRAP